MNFLKSALYVTALGGVFLLSSCGDRSVSEEDVKSWDTMLKNAKEEKKDLTAKNVTKFDIAVSKAVEKGWKKYTNTEGKFEVYMPWKPASIASSKPGLKMWDCAVVAGSNEYLVGYYDLGSAVTTKAGEERVEKNMIDFIFNTFNATKEPNLLGSYYTKVNLPNNHVAVKAKGKNASEFKYYQAKAIYNDSKVYFLITLKKYSNKQSDVDNFFNTFKLTSAKM